MFGCTLEGRKKNRIVIDNTNTNGVTKSAWVCKVPTILLANIMSLVPKMNEGSVFSFRHNIYLAFITQTYAKDSVSDGFVQIYGVVLAQKDRQDLDHVGVCAYIQEYNCKYKQLKDLNCCEDHESL